MSEIVSLYPFQTTLISKLMKYRPRRDFRTDLVYYFGPAGYGRTTVIYNALKTIRQLYGVDYYSKCGGLSKFWEGYDNQLISWLDDPSAASINMNGEDSNIQRFKNVVSTGADGCSWRN